jgi:hypothetical protein
MPLYRGGEVFNCVSALAFRLLLQQGAVALVSTRCCVTSVFIKFCVFFVTYN